MFGMGTGVAPPVMPPGTFLKCEFGVLRIVSQLFRQLTLKSNSTLARIVFARVRPCLSGAKMMMLNRTTD